MSPPFRGLFLPVTTPFGEDDRIAPERLAAQIELYAGCDISGILLFGTSGEGPLIDPDEEPPLLAAARSVLPDGWRLLVQVGRESLQATRRAAERAAAAGAQGLLCLPPRFYPLGTGELADQFRAVAAATALPVLAYHIPQRSHVDLPADLLIELAGEGVLSGIKNSAGDLALHAALRERAGPAFSILHGQAATVAAALDAGADGAILAVADAAPEACAVLIAAHAAGDADAVGAAQAALGPLGECLGARFGVPGIKAALDLRGWPGGGPPRPPLRPVDEPGRRAIAAALRAAGVDARVAT